MPLKTPSRLRLSFSNYSQTEYETITGRLKTPATFFSKVSFFGRIVPIEDSRLKDCESASSNGRDTSFRQFHKGHGLYYDPCSQLILKLLEVEAILLGLARTCPLEESTNTHLKMVNPAREMKDPIRPVCPFTVALSALVVIVLNCSRGRVVEPCPVIAHKIRAGLVVSMVSDPETPKDQPCVKS